MTTDIGLQLNRVTRQNACLQSQKGLKCIPLLTLPMNSKDSDCAPVRPHGCWTKCSQSLGSSWRKCSRSALRGGPSGQNGLLPLFRSSISFFAKVSSKAPVTTSVALVTNSFFLLLVRHLLLPLSPPTNDMNVSNRECFGNTNDTAQLQQWPRHGLAPKPHGPQQSLAPSSVRSLLVARPGALCSPSFSRSSPGAPRQNGCRTFPSPDVLLTARTKPHDCRERAKGSTR